MLLTRHTSKIKPNQKVESLGIYLLIISSLYKARTIEQKGEKDKSINRVEFQRTFGN